MKGTQAIPCSHRMSAGISIMETIVVAALISVFAAIAIPKFSTLTASSKTGVAQDMLESLNKAVHRFNMSNYELVFTGASLSGQDEILILRTMQYRDPVNPKPGSPYMRNDWNPAISSSMDDYRLMWTGSLFKLLSPGEVGTGLKVSFDGSALGTPFKFQPNFKMAGK